MGEKSPVQPISLTCTGTTAGKPRTECDTSRGVWVCPGTYLLEHSNANSNAYACELPRSSRPR